jgi:hypothetical protein
LELEYGQLEDPGVEVMLAGAGCTMEAMTPSLDIKKGRFMGCLRGGSAESSRYDHTIGAIRCSRLQTATVHEDPN